MSGADSTLAVRGSTLLDNRAGHERFLPQLIIPIPGRRLEGQDEWAAKFYYAGSRVDWDCGGFPLPCSWEGLTKAAVGSAAVAAPRVNHPDSCRRGFVQ